MHKKNIQKSNKKKWAQHIGAKQRKQNKNFTRDLNFYECIT